MIVRLFPRRFFHGQQWLTVGHDFSEVPFWAIGDRKTVSSEILS